MRSLKVRSSITLDADVADGIKLLAEQSQRSFSRYVNIILRDYLQKRSAEIKMDKAIR